MDDLEPYRGLYAKYEHGEYEKHSIHHAAVIMLNVYSHNSQVLYLSKFYFFLV